MLTVNAAAMPMVDYMNPAAGSFSNSLAKQLLENDLDIGVMRPYVGDDGRGYFTRNISNHQGVVEPQAVLLRNDNATLRILDWIQLDEAIIKAARPRLRAAKDLMSAGLVYNLPNGIAKTVMQFQQQSRITGATVSMDGLRRSESDRPVFTTLNFPIPIIHKDFSFPLRQLLASRTGYSPLDYTTGEEAGRVVAEQVEQFTLGTSSSLLQGMATYAWGGASIYGYMNFPQRLTYSITLPTAGGWTPQTFLNQVLQMKRLSQQAFHYGPWMMYFGNAWDEYMDGDYKATIGDVTLRERVKKIAGIIDARTVDYIPDYSVILVQQTSNVARMVIGLNFTTIQWEGEGGMEQNFKVMVVMIPQLRYDYNNNTGIVHGNG